jgi:ribonucleoside-diphosphate reductase alpha chain
MTNPIAEVTPEEFFGGDEIRIGIFNSKYPRNEGESVNQCFRNVTEEICSVKIEKQPKQWSERWVQEMMDDMWRPGGSILAACNKPDKKISVFNCTTIGIEADNLESIYSSRYKACKVAAYRQGLGADFSKLRPKGTPVNNSAEVSEGAVHWMRSFDRIADEVGQRGRIPAILCSLKVGHPDIKEFIGSKDDTGKLENVNISVQMTDEFMKAVDEDLSWELSFMIDDDPSRVWHSETLRARVLFDMICEHAWQTGEPGLQFIDKMGIYSIQEALGERIISTNACSEKPLVDDGVCGLLSANMAKVPPVKSKKFKPYIHQLAYSITRFMDNVVEYEIENHHKSPLPTQLEVVKRLREIGLGVTNIHQWLYDQGMQYDSDEGIDALEEFFKWYFYYVFKASVELAKERGPCPAWKDCKKSGKLDELITPFLADKFEIWPDLRKDWLNVGLRNAALLSIAPTGSLSQTFSQDCLSWGIEPTIGWYYWRKTRAIKKGIYEFYFVIPTAIKQIVLREMSRQMITGKDLELIENFPGSVLDEDGSIGKKYIRILKKYLDTKLLKTAMEIDVYKKVDMMSKVQRFVDAAISVTYNVPNNFTLEQTKKLYMEAYEKNLKALTVYREGTREAIIVYDFPKDRRIQMDNGFERPETITYVHGPKRPAELKAERYKVLKHHVIVGLMDDKPYEVFIIEHDEWLPKTGWLIKRSRRRYMFCNDEKEDILNVIDKQNITDEIKAITRLTSTNLRHGVPIDFVCDQLKKCGDIINAYPKMLGRILEKYKFMYLAEKDTGEICDICEEPLTYYDGCLKCMNPECGFSKCG